MNNEKTFSNSHSKKVSLARKYNCEFFIKFANISAIILGLVALWSLFNSHPNVATCACVLLSICVFASCSLHELRLSFKHKPY